MQTPPLLQQLLFGLVVLTSTGTLVQDTKLGRALEVTVPLSEVSSNLSYHLDGLNEAASHTHVERASMAQDMSGIPRVQARDDHKRYVMNKYASRNSSPDGDSQLVWPSI